MESWAWDERWTLGHEEIDAQHRGVHACWERLRSQPAARRAEAWKALVAQMREHFEHEDRLMDRSGFAHRRHHQRDHKAFLAEMDAIQEDAEAGFPVEDGTVEAVRSWLGGHVRGLDRDFLRFLEQREAWDLKAGWEMEEFDLRAARIPG